MVTTRSGARASKTSGRKKQEIVAKDAFDDEEDMDRVIAAHIDDGEKGVSFGSFALLCFVYGGFCLAGFEPSSNSDKVAIKIFGGLIKCFPVWYLAHAVGRGNSFTKYIFFGLCASSVGDFTLELASLKRVGISPDLCDGAFLFGLVSFLIAHLLYVRAFMRGTDATESGKGEKALLCFGTGGLIVATLWGSLPSGLKVPVVLYGLAISSMAFYALRQPVGSASSQFAVAGSVIFIVSDTVLAFNKFLFKGDWTGATSAIMLTYYSAQYLLASCAASRD